MKKNSALLAFIFLALRLLGSDDIHKDLDGDGIKDIVTYDKENDKLICKLSSKKFKPITTELCDADNCSLKETKSGFEFQSDFMRAGHALQFKYEASTKKIRLIGMSRYEFGPANNDGSGESSVNLLTGDYIGEWNHYDLKKEELIKLPTIKMKMSFPKIYLEDYDPKYEGQYEDKCVEMFEEAVRKYEDANH